MTAWWTWLPSMRPIKGIANFVYVWANWGTIDEERKQSRERLHHTEDAAQRLIRFKEQAHAEEKKALERELQQERAKFRELASHAHYAAEVMQDIDAKLEAAHQRSAETRGFVRELSIWLAATIFYISNANVRNSILSRLSSSLRERLQEDLAFFDEGDPALIQDRFPPKPTIPPTPTKKPPPAKP